MSVTPLLPKPYYEADGVTIYHGDSRLVLPLIGDRSVEMIWTDPPYGNNNNNGDLIHRRRGRSQGTVPTSGPNFSPCCSSRRPGS